MLIIPIDEFLKEHGQIRCENCPDEIVPIFNYHLVEKLGAETVMHVELLALHIEEVLTRGEPTFDFHSQLPLIVEAIRDYGRRHFKFEGHDLEKLVELAETGLEESYDYSGADCTGEDTEFMIDFIARWLLGIPLKTKDFPKEIDELEDEEED